MHDNYEIHEIITLPQYGDFYVKDINSFNFAAYSTHSSEYSK